MLFKSLVAFNQQVAFFWSPALSQIVSDRLLDRLVALTAPPFRTGAIHTQAVWILDNLSMDLGNHRHQVLRAKAIPAATKVSSFYLSDLAS